MQTSSPDVFASSWQLLERLEREEQREAMARNHHRIPELEYLMHALASNGEAVVTHPLAPNAFQWGQTRMLYRAIVDVLRANWRGPQIVPAVVDELRRAGRGAAALALVGEPYDYACEKHFDLWTLSEAFAALKRRHLEQRWRSIKAS